MSLLVLFNFPALPQLASDAASAVEIKTSGATDLVSTGLPIELISTFRTDRNILAEWLIAGRAECGALPEWLLASRLEGAVPSEWLESQIGSNAARLELIAAQSLDRGYPVEWSASQSASYIALDEWTQALRGDAVAGGEWAASQLEDIANPFEFYPRVSREEVGVLSEWGSTQPSDAATSAEVLSAQREDAATLLEWVLSGRLDAGPVIEWLFSQREDGGSLSEWLQSEARNIGTLVEWIGGVTVQISDGTLLVEWLSSTGSQISNAALPIELFSAAVVNAAALAEWTFSLRADTGALISTLTAQRENVSAWLEAMSAQTSGARMAPLEWVAGIYHDARAVAELLNSSSIDRSVPVELLSRQAEAFASAVGWLATQYEDAKTAAELLLSQYADDEILSEILTGAAQIASTQLGPMEWLSLGRSAHHLTLVDFISGAISDGAALSEALWTVQSDSIVPASEWTIRLFSDVDSALEWIGRATTSATGDVSFWVEILATKHGKGEVIVINITPTLGVSNVLTVPGDLTPKSE